VFRVLRFEDRAVERGQDAYTAANETPALLFLLVRHALRK
jgi:hypothetical protein